MVPPARVALSELVVEAARPPPGAQDEWADHYDAEAFGAGVPSVAPRAEIRPEFQRAETGGKSGHGALTIRADGREGLHGWWQQTLPVTTGRHYRFSGWRRAENVAVPRRSVLARVLWRIKNGWPEPLAGGSRLEHRMAKIVHWLLITVTLAMPISGMMNAPIFMIVV